MIVNLLTVKKKETHGTEFCLHQPDNFCLCIDKAHIVVTHRNEHDEKNDRFFIDFVALSSMKLSALE